MDIGAALSGVQAHHYNHHDGPLQPAQHHLREIYRQLPAKIPPGMKVLVSGAGRSLPIVPWIAVINPDITTTAQQGLYVVYLYRADLSRVYLSMNQGATQHRTKAEERGHRGVSADRAALAELRQESELIRAHLAAATLDGLVSSIDLGAPRFLPHAYEEGNIAAIEYETTHLPDENVLRANLARFLTLYDNCVKIKRQILADNPGLMNTTAESEKLKRIAVPQPPDFRPKDSTEYRAQIPAQIQVKDRRHEALITAFRNHLVSVGLVVANNVHPRDLTVDSPTTHWLVEAKTVGPNAAHAVREAIGQLFDYRHFYYRDLERPDPALVALFAGPVGDALVDLLTSLGIEAIWLDNGEWHGHAPAGSNALLAAAGR